MIRLSYEFPINRHFYRYKPLHPLDGTEGEFTGLEDGIAGLPKGPIQ